MRFGQLTGEADSDSDGFSSLQSNIASIDSSAHVIHDARPRLSIDEYTVPRFSQEQFSMTVDSHVTQSRENPLVLFVKLGQVL